MGQLREQGLDAVGAVYDAVDRPQAWPQLLDAVAEQLQLDEVADGARSPHAETEAQQLLPHLRRALNLIDGINRSEDSRRAMAAVLDRLPLGIFLVDFEARLEFANSCARDLLAHGAPLSLVDGCLRGRRGDETRKLHQLIAEALRSSEEARAARALVFRDETGAGALSVLILSVQSLQYESQRPLAAVFVAAPEFWQSLNPATLHDLYGLTEAESRLVDRLCAGRSLQEAAEELEVSTNTVRTHLRAIFGKTGTSRQSDLLREVITGVAYLSKPKAIQRAAAAEGELPDREVGCQMSDGRWLSCREYGDPQGWPLLLHNHATLGNRLQVADQAVLLQQGVRLLIVDRPGFGESDAQPNRRLQDWPDDAAALLDHLKIKRCAVLGYGIGATFALAFALAQPKRVQLLSLVAASMPTERLQNPEELHALHRLVGYLSRRFPTLQRRLMSILVRGGLADPASYFRQIRSRLCAPDREALKQDQLEQRLIEAGRHAVRQGADALCTDLQLHVQDWPFDPADLQVPNQFWLGLQDQMMAPSNGRLLAERLPDGLRHLEADAGNLILFSHWEAIIASIQQAIADA